MLSIRSERRCCIEDFEPWKGGTYDTSTYGKNLSRSSISLEFLGSDDRMEKISDKIASLPPKATYFSLEFFPPKTEAGFSNLQARLSRMAYALQPLFVTVTWGAGGSTAVTSLELAEVCQRRLGITTCLHLTCTNMSRSLVDEAVNQAKALGVRNILALRGDPPRSSEYGTDGDEDSNKDFMWAIDLVRYLRKVHGDYFCIGVAGYPEGHADGSHPDHRSIEQDLPHLVDKVTAGADFIMTQVVFDIASVAKYEITLRSHCSGAFTSIPIIPGLMPIQSYQIVKRITHLSNVQLPPHISSRIEAVKADDEAVKRVGVQILSEMVNDLKALPRPASEARGFHFYTLNLEKSVASILGRCALIPRPPEPSISSPTGSTCKSIAAIAKMGPSLITTKVGEQSERTPHLNGLLSSDLQSSTRHSDGKHKPASDERKSHQSDDFNALESSDTHQTVSGPADTSGRRSSRSCLFLASDTHGSLVSEATWDEYPNGRWGPSSSPAFGEIDGYGPSLKVGPVMARQLWNYPKTYADITRIFKRHVEGGLLCLPWSDENNTGKGGALQAETETIKYQLLWLIEKRGFWTIASQPAVNGVKNEDEVFGWGPPGEGFVFQKAFVEFFVRRNVWDNELKPQLRKYEKKDISWLKTDSSGNYESSSLAESSVNPRRSRPRVIARDVNAVEVTWGVFQGEKTVTPTIIEEESFRAWGEEAYGIWEEWRKVYPRGSEEERFLDLCRRESVLVNVVGHQYSGKSGERLWEILKA